MENRDIMTLEAVGEFPFTFFIEKAVPSGDAEKDMILEGVASTTNVDHDHERMTKEAIDSMANIINKEGVPLRVEHSKEDDAIIGTVYEASVDERNQLHIKARLDKDHMVSSILYRSMQTGAKMGFSVGGIVKRAVQEFSEKLGKGVKTFYEVALKEVSVTPRPANYDAWAVAKSIKVEDRETTFYKNRFLFENPHLDYLQVFAKSIPDEAWRKTASQSNPDNMATKTDKTEGKTDMDTEKAVSRGEFSALTSLMSKGFENITNVLRKMTGEDAMDAVNPDTKKPEPEKVTAKAEGEAMDQNNPDAKKPDPEEVRAKTAADGTDENGTREKAATETDEKKEKATKEDSKDETEMKSIASLVKSIEELGFKMGKTSDKEETKEKSDKESESEEFADKAEVESTETTKTAHPLDTLVFAMAKTMQAMGERLEKDGMRIPGFEKNYVERLQNDPAFQKSVSELMAVPGFKKSVSMGVPYVPTKEGGRLALTLTPAGATTISKSADAKGKTFADVYKKDFSSVSSSDTA